MVIDRLRDPQPSSNPRPLVKIRYGHAADFITKRIWVLFCIGFGIANDQWRGQKCFKWDRNIAPATVGSIAPETAKFQQWVNYPRSGSIASYYRDRFHFPSQHSGPPNPHFPHEYRVRQYLPWARAVDPMKLRGLLRICAAGKYCGDNKGLTIYCTTTLVLQKMWHTLP